MIEYKAAGEVVAIAVAILELSISSHYFVMAVILSDS